MTFGATHTCGGGETTRWKAKKNHPCLRPTPRARGRCLKTMNETRQEQLLWINQRQHGQWVDGTPQIWVLFIAGFRQHFNQTFIYDKFNFIILSNVWDRLAKLSRAIIARDQPKEKPKCLGCSRNCRNVSAERPANWARPICRRPFRLISNHSIANESVQNRNAGWASHFTQMMTAAGEREAVALSLTNLQKISTWAVSLRACRRGGWVRNRPGTA